MAAPSFYFPDKFVLSDGPIQEVATAEDFPRVVFSADGLSLPEGVAANDTLALIQWVLESGARAAAVAGYKTGPVHVLDLFARDPADTRPSAEMLLTANESTGLSQILATVGDAAGGLTQKKVLDSDGKSSFLQLLASGEIAVDFGVANMHWAGINPFADTLVIPHGIGRVPQVGLAVPGWVSFNNQTYFRVNVRNLTANDIQLSGITGDNTNPGVQNWPVYWLVIG